MKIKHRIDKDELKEDRFQQTVERVAEFYYADPRRFWLLAAVVLVVIVGVILLIQNRPKPMISPEAELRLMDAVGNYFQGNNEYAEQALTELATRFGKEYAGIRAHYYLGNLYLRSQPPRLEEAKREFNTFLKNARKNPVLTPAALMGLAVCAEKQGNFLGAAGIYEKVYRRFAQSPLGFEAMMQAGRCYRQAGALDRAEKVYDELLKKEKGTGSRAEEIRVELAYVRALKNRL